MRITPKQIPGRQGYRAQFRHPLTKKVITKGLDTRDEIEAGRICRDIEGILADPALLSDPNSPRLGAYDRRAVRAVHGEAVADSVLALQQRPTLDESDVAQLAGFLLTVLDVHISKKETVAGILQGFESKRYGELQGEFRKLENEVKVLRPRVEYLESELMRVRRSQNLHVKVTVGAAVAEWRVQYVKTCAPITAAQSKFAVDAFVNSLPSAGEFRLADVRAKHVDTWLENVRNQSGKELSPVTKKKMRAYLSSFVSWALRKYDLAENPMDRTMPLAGVSRNPEHIVAIRRLTELTALFDGLKKSPYWRAWIATACLAGPRWSEQVWLKVDDVFLDEGYIRITSRASGKRILGTKTGRERNVPIESTVLHKILAEHIATRRAEQKKKNATTAEASVWLFPSTVDEGGRPREKTEPGQWSSGRVWMDAWREVATAAGKPKAEGETMLSFWRCGPKEWRHTFGTALGQCGWTSLEISRAMGNSSAIAERHYVAQTEAGKRWPFKW